MMPCSEQPPLNLSLERVFDELGPASCRAVLEEVPDLRFFMKDHRGVYLHASRPMYLAHGFSRPEGIVGRADHDFIPRYLADHYVADDRQVLEGQAVLGRVELVTRHRGCPDWYVTSKTVLRARDGRVLGLIGISRELGEAARLPGAFSALSPVMDYIRKDYAESLEIDALARIAKQSPRTFQRHFRKVFHVTPMEYVRQFRVGKACQFLVETDDTITAIAAATGFCDHSHLTREFTRCVGTTPGEYRRRYRRE